MVKEMDKFFNSFWSEINSKKENWPTDQKKNKKSFYIPSNNESIVMKHIAFTYTYTPFKIHTHICTDKTQKEGTVYTINFMPMSTFPTPLNTII